MKKYDHKKIEKKWQKFWDANKVFEVKNTGKPSKDNMYILDMFPYPSGAGLHVGHPEGYTATDILSRYHRMNGRKVLHPMGWDAFGLPAENYAIKEGVHPAKTTQKNINRFREQIKSIGLSYDWTREISTADPDYYKWTQWLFLLMYKNGLAYKKEAYVNWCPKDNTVLANEQVINGACDRCGTQVEQRLLSQWFLKITDFAERLLDDIKGLDWPAPIMAMQKNWIGKSEGAELEFEVRGSSTGVKVFTTRPDTLFGATYLVLAPEHALVEAMKEKIQNFDEVQKYQKATKSKSELQRTALAKEKTGVELKGISAINPATKEEIPIFIADYVLIGYGTGAIMAVPAHDERDNEFAKKFNLSIRQVIEPVLIQGSGSAAFREKESVQDSHGIIAIIKHWSEDKYLGLRWPKAGWGTLLTGGIDEGFTPEQTVLKEILEETGYKNAKIVQNLGIIHSKYYHEPKKLNRFGHAPTFYVELQNGEANEVSEEEKAKHELLWLTKTELRTFLTATSHTQALDLLGSGLYFGPGLLTNSQEFDGLNSDEAKKKITEFVGGKMIKQYHLRDWLISRQRYWGAPIPIIYCDVCGPQPVPEKDLPVKLPTDVDFKPTGESPLARSKTFHKVFCPKCKASARRDSDTMDTFVDSSWYFLRFLDPKNKKEFAEKKFLEEWMPVDMYVGGAEHAVLHLLYARFFTKVLYDLKFVKFQEPFLKLRNQGLILGPDGEKMSKSRGNVINPDEVIALYGADTLRMYEMFMGPLEDAKPWSTQGMIGVRRYLDRVWVWGNGVVTQNAKVKVKTSEVVDRALHKLIKKITEDIESLSLNTAISSFMSFHNEVKDESISVASLHSLLSLLYPFAPHIAEELYEMSGGKKSLQLQHWPKFDAEKILESTAQLIIQVNGKLKDKLSVPMNISEVQAKELAMNSDKIKIALAGAAVKRIIYVPNRLLNIVV